MRAQTFEQIKKYNPYHGKDGKFTSGGSAAKTVRSRKSQVAADLTGDTGFGGNESDGWPLSGLSSPAKATASARGLPGWGCRLAGHGSFARPVPDLGIKKCDE